MTVITRSNGSFILPAQSVSTTSAQISNYDSHISCLWFSNPTSAPIAVTLTDGNGSPLFPGTAVPQNSRMSIENVFAQGGINVVAAGVGLFIGGQWSALG